MDDPVVNALHARIAALEQKLAEAMAVPVSAPVPVPEAKTAQDLDEEIVDRSTQLLRSAKTAVVGELEGEYARLKKRVLNITDSLLAAIEEGNKKSKKEG